MWFENQGHYRNRMPLWLEFKQIFNAILLVMLIDVFLRFTFKQEFSRLFMISGWVTTAIAIVIGRSVTRTVLKKYDLWHIKVLVIGTGSAAKKAIETINLEQELGYKYVGSVWPNPAAIEQGKVDWQEIYNQHNADHIIIAGDRPELANKIIEKLLRLGIPFSLFTVLQSLPAGNLSMYQFINQRAFLIIHDSKLQQFMPRALKRGCDIVFSIIALIGLLPLMLIISFFVRLDGGPATFKHGRIGIKGKKFDCLKFRSMIQNSEEALKLHLAENPEARAEWERDQKLSKDPRISAIGSFLRKSSLDELPQLINVIKGEMSLVGPRPIVTAEVYRYSENIDDYTIVRPGITGLWQVSGRNNVSYDERVEMDAWYVRNWSIWLDIFIILKTIPALLSKSGAY
jgi:undecaprenyl-phosphate galactose phosphotransferase